MSYDVEMKFPRVIDVSEPWWKSRTEEQRREVGRHFAMFGVDPDVTCRIEVRGDQLVVWTYHLDTDGRSHTPCDKNEWPEENKACVLRSVMSAFQSRV